MKIQLSNNLRTLRKERHMTQEELAERLNVSVGVISKWERGASEPELLCLISLAEVFNVSVDALIGYSMMDEDPEVLVKKIESLKAKRKLSEAEEIVKEALLKYPNNFSVVYSSADLYALEGYTKEKDNAGDYTDKAISLYRKAITLISQDKEKKHSEVEIKNRIAMCLLEQDKVDEAIETLKANNVNGLNDDLLGYIYVIRRKNYEEGMEYLASSAASIIAKFIRIMSGFINVYAYTGKYEMAEKSCALFDAVTKAMAVDCEKPTFFDKINALMYAAEGGWHVRLDDNEKARACMTRAYDIAKKFDENPDYSANNIIGIRELKDGATAFDDAGPTAMASVEQLLLKEDNRVGLPLWKEIVKENENKRTD